MPVQGKNMTNDYVNLSSGLQMPLLGLGTWKSEPGVVEEAVEAAIRMGYRHIDCAAVYGNEAEVGFALKKCLDANVCNREELFVTSKLWIDSKAPEDVIPALRESLEKLRLDYLDLYLIHWPVSLVKGSDSKEFHTEENLPNSKIWEKLEEAVALGYVKSIGVSNFSDRKLEKLLEHAKIPPAVNQIERHPYLQRQKLMQYCRLKQIHVTSYCPLGSMDRPISLKESNEPILLQAPEVKQIASKHGCTPAQVLIRWSITTGSSVIPKSTNKERLKENLDSLKVKLSPEDLAVIGKLEQGVRFVDGSFWCQPENSPWTMETLWDGV
eukprot:scaffold45227_cov199-Amphora_coffeaeformis.AAC.2